MPHKSLQQAARAAATAVLIAFAGPEARAQSFDDDIGILAEQVAEAFSIRNLGREETVDLFVRTPFDDVYRVVCAPLSRRLARVFRARLPEAMASKNVGRVRVVQRQGMGDGQFTLNVSWRDIGAERLEIAFEIGDLSGDQVATVDGGSVEMAKTDLREDERDCLADLRVVNRVVEAEELLFVHRSANVFSDEIAQIEAGQRFRLLGRMPYTDGNWAVVRPMDAPDDPFAETVGFAIVPKTPQEIAREAEAKAAEARAAEEKARRLEEARAAEEAERKAEEEARQREIEEARARARAEAEARIEAAKKRAEDARRAQEAERRAQEAEARAAAAEEQARNAERQAKLDAERQAKLDAEREAARGTSRDPVVTPPNAGSSGQDWGSGSDGARTPSAQLPGQWQCAGSGQVNAQQYMQMNFRVIFNPDNTYVTSAQAAVYASASGQLVNQAILGEYGFYQFDGTTVNVNPQGGLPVRPLSPYQVRISNLAGQSMVMTNVASGIAFNCQRIS